MKYEIKTLKLGNGIERLTIIFEDSKLKPLHPFIVDDFSAFTQDYLETFDKVLSGEVERESASGNACYFEADKEKTFIEFLYPEDEDTRETCTVNTRELRSLMDEWVQKRTEFFKTHSKSNPPSRTNFRR